MLVESRAVRDLPEMSFPVYDFGGLYLCSSHRQNNKRLWKYSWLKKNLVKKATNLLFSSFFVFFLQLATQEMFALSCTVVNE